MDTTVFILLLQVLPVVVCLFGKHQASNIIMVAHRLLTCTLCRLLDRVGR